jgi:hypothetical protein
MRRSGFALGVAVGGLVGVAVGYLMSRNGHLEAEMPVGSIDLTPTMEAEIAKAESPSVAEATRPARARRKEATDKEE